MNERSRWTPEERDRLEQELLELHFGCHEDPSDLERRLEADPALRALRDEVLGQADVLARAVHPELPRLDLPSPDAAASAARRPRWWHLPLGRVTMTAAAALLFVLGFLAWEQWSEWRLARHRSEHVHLTVSAPKAVPAGAPWSFTVQTQDLNGNAADCRVRWRAFDEDDGLLLSGDAVAVDGTSTIALAATLATPSRVEVEALGFADHARETFTLSRAHAGPLVHVTTDRPVYRPGEPVYVRVVVLDRVTRRPLGGPSAMVAQLLDARGAAVANDYDNMTPAGVGSLALRVPEQSGGGVHRVVVSSNIGLFAKQSVDVVVRAFRNPQLDTEIVLDRESYAPGARGAASVRTRRLADDAAANGAAVRAALVVDGDEVWSEETTLDDDGDATFRFVVPDEVEKGAARFVARVTDGGVVETEVEPFVVPTGEVLVAAFPEGGELVAGVENRVYLECTDPLGRAIDTAGELVDGDGRRVATFMTAHLGRARVAFVPEAGASYRVRVGGQQETHDLPDVQARGVALRTLTDEVAAAASLRVAVAGRGDGPWLLGVFCRGVLVGQTTLRPDAKGEVDAVAEVPLPVDATGVLRATVFDRNLRPVAERLLRRRSARRVDVALTPRAEVLTPGDRQTMLVATNDERGRPVRAVVGLRCTDDAVTSLGLEPRVGLEDHALLFADVHQLEDVGDFFLTDDASARNVDLLLGTRGWRRFVWRNDDRAKAAIVDAGDAGEGILAREGFSQTPQVLSNLDAARATSAGLARSAREAARLTRDVTMAAILLVGLLALVELIAFGLRRATRAPVFVQAFGGVLGAAAVLIGLFAALQNTLGSAPDSAMAVSTAPTDSWTFERVEGFGGAGASSVTSFAEVPTRLPFDLGAGGWDDRLLFDFSSNDFIAFRSLSAGAPTAELTGQTLAPPTVTGIPAWDPLEQPNRETLDAASAGALSLFVPADRTNLSYDEFDRVSSWLARQYAHEHTPTADGERRDFTPTILWNTLVVTDERGHAEVAFDTSDAATTWRVDADAHVAVGDVGRVGQGTATFTTQLPLQIEPKLPDEVSSGDRLLLPVAAVLRRARLDEATLQVDVGDGLRLGPDAPTRIALEGAPGEAARGRALVPVDVTDFVGVTTITIEARAGRHVDRVRHTLTVAPRGFPHRRAQGGRLTAAEPAEWRLVVPDDAVPNSGSVLLKVYPSPIAALTEGLEGILREPHGCFEQASSSNYPNTLVLNLLEANGDDVPVVAARARALLPKGYAKITGYECRERGYEWFGNDPGHEALTAYGLLQFHDMARVYDVDMAMVDRTRQWLLARRDGNGNYPHPTVDRHSFGGRDPLVTNAYVTYALLQAGTPAKELEVEVDALVRRVVPIDPVHDPVGPYELALIACALHLAERPEAATAREQLATLQREDGSLPGAKSSITMSGGRDLLVETAGFAVLAWLHDARFTDNVRRAIAYLQTARDARGTFGATQATIVALKALTSYATATRRMREGGTVRVFDGDELLAERAFDADEVGALTFELWPRLAAGEHTLRLEVDGGGESPLPWAGEVSYHAALPADDPDAATAITASLRARTVTEGETVALDVTIENRTGRELPTPMASIGLPAGLAVPTDVLHDMQDAERFSSWELRGRELVIYWTRFAPEHRVELTIDLIANVPGETTGPASRTWLYYTPGQKRWAAPLRVRVDAAR